MSECTNYYQLPLSGQNCFYDGVNNNNDDCKPRFTDKTCNEGDIDTTSEIIKDAIERTGIAVNYYVNTTTMTGADPLYGEQPLAVYNDPVEMTMYIELEEDAIEFTKFGIRADDSITAYVHISSYAEAFDGDDVYSSRGWYVEPKADDVFELAEYGSTRPGDRSGKYFIVTERMDSDIAAINPLGGHYVWRLRGKRFEWSFEPGLSGEGGDNQIIDNTFQGRLTGGDNPATDDLPYDNDIDTYSRDNVFDMDNIDSSPYGDYD